MRSRRLRFGIASLLCYFALGRTSFADVSAVPPAEPAPQRLLPVDTRSYLAATTGAGARGLGPGIGGRLGTTFTDGVSVGASATYQGWETGRLARIGSALFSGLEFGYDFNLRYLTVRPYFAGGMALTVTSGEGTGTADAKLSVWGGAQAVYDIRKTRMFIAVDLRLISTMGQDDLNVAGFGGFGLKFGS